jgi:hypothetical protein
MNSQESVLAPVLVESIREVEVVQDPDWRVLVALPASFWADEDQSVGRPVLQNPHLSWLLDGGLIGALVGGLVGCTGGPVWAALGMAAGVVLGTGFAELYYRRVSTPP